MAPKVPLPLLILASVFLDVVWSILLMADVEHAHIEPGFTLVSPVNFHDYPYSHSLVAALGWAALLGFAYFFVREDFGGGRVVGLVALSHWPLDVIVHRPDLPIYPGGPERFGYGLWNSVGQTLLLEGAIFVGGILIYSAVTEAKDRAGSYGFWLLMTLLAWAWLDGIFGPPPPSITAVAVANLTGAAILIAWTAWIEHHRIVRL